MKPQKRIAPEIAVSPKGIADTQMPDIILGNVPLLDYLVLVIRPVLPTQYDVDIQLAASGSS